MGYKVLEKRSLIPGQTTMLLVEAPHVAAKAKPGNFVILRVNDTGERIPLTIADVHPEVGAIVLVFLVVGKTTALLNALETGDELLDVCGPLGKPTRIESLPGLVVCVGGGTGVAAMYHIAKGHVAAGNHVIAVIGARNKDLLLFCDELSEFCAEVRIATNDGSFGRQGFVTDVLKDILDSGDLISEVVAVGPVPMMEAVSNMTRPYDICTTVSLNSIMVDGIGMCGACRCNVGGETRFACVEGPEFDGHLVDFDALRRRLGQFREQEQLSYERYKEGQ